MTIFGTVEVYHTLRCSYVPRWMSGSTLIRCPTDRPPSFAPTLCPQVDRHSGDAERPSNGRIGKTFIEQSAHAILEFLSETLGVRAQICYGLCSQERGNAPLLAAMGKVEDAPSLRVPPR